MSSWIHLLPVSEIVSQQGGPEWLTRTEQSGRGGWDRGPEPSTPLPSGRDVVAAVSTSGCHGRPWFVTADGDGDDWLPPPDPAAPAEADLGEVSLSPAGELCEPLTLDTPICSVGLRKPNSAAALRLACALAGRGAPLVAFGDDALSRSLLVLPGDGPDDLRAWWPW